MKNKTFNYLKLWFLGTTATRESLGCKVELYALSDRCARGSAQPSRDPSVAQSRDCKDFARVANFFLQYE